MYTIKNDKLQVVVKSFGAELNSIKKTDSDHEYLWQGDPAYWKRQAPILFPIVGRLLEDTFTYSDNSYHMTQHGFARDSEFTCVEFSTDSVLFKLVSSDLSLNKYPFTFELYLGYELIADHIKVTYKVVNTDSKVMPFSIGAHPAFNWNKSLEANFSFSEKVVSSCLVSSKGIIEGPEVSLKETPLTEALFHNDALIYKGLESTIFRNGEIGIEMNFDGFPYVGLWSLPSGAPFVCIEPWYGIGDCQDHDQNILNKEGMISLNIGEVFEAFYTIKPI
ncbi:MAG: aldose 1-epimerase family protein [Clostridiales bacterium]|nr:aldose 1-epimerase family protein [Clostridiales bacterium]